MVGHEALPTHLSVVVDIFETHFEEIIAAYEERLFAIGSPLVTEAQMREQVKAQAHLVLKEVVMDLRGREAPSGAQQSEDRLSETIGVSRASDNIHAVHSLRAVVAFSEAALSIVIGNLPPSLTLSSEIVTVALALQKSIMNRVMRAALT